VRPEHLEALEALLARMRPHERLADARDAALLIIGWKEAIAGGVAGRSHGCGAPAAVLYSLMSPPRIDEAHRFADTNPCRVPELGHGL
jgi:hypothetical protein